MESRNLKNLQIGSVGLHIAYGKNTDGGKPQYFNNDHDLLFATQAGKLWRYSCDTGECECIWQKQFSDQSITFGNYSVAPIM